MAIFMPIFQAKLIFSYNLLCLFNLQENYLSAERLIDCFKAQNTVKKSDTFGPIQRYLTQPGSQETMQTSVI